ncbi:MAG: hypothetical protein NXI27_13775 [Alphaproteobacteria bacterium]|nr:hypothetical protein [Alphaproteobacteria bacterium]
MKASKNAAISLIFALGLLTGAAHAQSGDACYTKSDCECAAEGGHLQNGAWVATVEPGVFQSSSGTVFPLNAGEGPLDIAGYCDGRLYIRYTDQEVGPIEWHLNRVSKQPTSVTPFVDELYLEEIQNDVWDEFKAISPELEEFAEDNLFFTGNQILTVQGQPMPATMLFSYSGTHDRGAASLTIKLGPFQGFTFWARTGKAKFERVGSNNVSQVYVERVCRCNEVEYQLGTYRSALRQMQLMADATRGPGMQRVGQGNTVAQEATDDNPENNLMMSQGFDPTQNWVEPGTAGEQTNWPCVADGRKVKEAGVAYVEFIEKVDVAAIQAEVDKRYLHLTEDAEQGAESTKVKPDENTGRRTAAAAFTHPGKCTVDLGDSTDICKYPDVVREAIAKHEAVHSATCVQDKTTAEKMFKLIKDHVVAGRIPENSRLMSSQLAKKAQEQNVHQCFGYKARTRNAFHLANDEIKAYKRAISLLEPFVKRYCSQ